MIVSQDTKYYSPMTQLFDDIVFTVRGREYAYRAHMLDTDEATHSGFATAALVAVWMLGTDEAIQRGLTSLDTPEDRTRLMDRYEAETFREDGGLLILEIEALYWWLWHIANGNENENEEAILMLGVRQLSLWSTLINEYMTRLVNRWADAVLTAEDTIVDSNTYLDFLLSQLAAYSRIQRMRQICWCDRDSVEDFWALSESEPGWITEHINLRDIITHLPAEVDEKSLMERYFALRQSEHALRLLKPTATEWYAAEQKPLDKEPLSYLSTEQQTELNDQHKRWLRYLSKKLNLVLTSQMPSIWTEKVSDQLEEKLIAYLTIQEGTRAWARNLRAALFAMQQMHWVKSDLTVAEFRRWASKYLQRDYATENARVALSKWWYEWNKDDDTITLHIRRLKEM